MSIDVGSDRLEDRLERLAKLHRDGHLDDEEYRVAKAMVLAPAAAPGPPPGPSPPGVRTLGPFRWRAWLLIAIAIGFLLACLGSAVAAFAIIAVLVWVIRGLRGPPRSDGPADLVST